jgi:hypothetical protein
MSKERLDVRASHLLCNIILPACVFVTLIIIPLLIDRQPILGSLIFDLVARLFLTVGLIYTYRSLPTIYTQSSGVLISTSWLAAEARDNGLALRAFYYFNVIGSSIALTLITWWSFSISVPTAQWWGLIFSLLQGVFLLFFLAPRYSLFRETILQDTHRTDF